MKLIKGGKPSAGNNVITGDFSVSDNSLFYARAFYELPLPGLVVEAFGDFRIADANRLAIEELARSPLTIIGKKFVEVFDSSLSMPALVSLAGVPAYFKNNAKREVSLISGDVRNTFELFGINSMDARGASYLILLFRARPANSDDADSALSWQLTDAVTGLPNTFGAERKIELLCHSLSRRSRDLVVALFSLEGWRKEVANFSSDLADDLIASMALCLRPWIDDGIFVSRYRSDEFMVILSGRDDFRDVLRDIYEALTDEFIVHGFSFNFSVNAGFYVRDIWDSLRAEDLLAKARKAVLRAKLEGGSRLVAYSDKMQRSLNNGHKAAEIVDAFRRGEFYLDFQPAVCFSTGGVGFAEGLLRWTHPDQGVQKPVEFLEYLQEMAIYDEVGLWVLDLALSTIEGWGSEELNIPLFINIGARQLADEVFFKRAVSVLLNFEPSVSSRLGIDVINLSELPDIHLLAKHMRTLANMGVRFSIDDFGAGDTRLFSAARLPVDSIKLSQSYVSNLADDLGSMFIVQNIVEFATQNGVSVYAKGVENPKQFNLLKAFGCAGAQGFAISKPLPEADFVDYLQRFGPDEMAELEPGVTDAQGAEVFSFALTEHKALLKEMLTQSIHQEKTLNHQVDNLEAFLEAMSKLEDGMAASPEKRVQSELIRQSVRQLIASISAGGKGEDGPMSVDVREVVLLLSELIVAVSEMVD